MKWSMDTHKYMSEVTRKALQVLAERNINVDSEAQDIEAAERKLAEVGVYKNFDGARGRIRRALFTYFKAYDCMKENGQLTEVGVAFVENKLSVQEISFYYVVNYLFEMDGVKYYPVQLILKCLKALYEKDQTTAYLTPYDFSLIVECDSLDQVNNEFTERIRLSHHEDQPNVNERAIGYDVWAKMLSQAGIVEIKNHNLVLTNIELATWILSSYDKEVTRNRGSLTSGVLKFFPVIHTGRGNGDPAAFTHEGKALQAFLFDNVPEKTIDKYITVDSNCSLTKMREALGLNSEQAGYYGTFSGLERLVGRALSQSCTGLQKAIGEILLNIEVIGKEEDEKVIETEKLQPSYSIDELGAILTRMYETAGNKTTAIHMFGLKYGEIISRNGYSAGKLVNASNIPDSYHVEVSKGLAIYKAIKNDEYGIHFAGETSVSETVGKHKELPTLPKRVKSENSFELNSILYGAPGTGKTYATAKYALAIVENKSLDEISNESREEIMMRYNNLIKSEQVLFTTFHQNYGYEDFIQGIRPDTSTTEMRFKTVDGVFKQIVKKAMDSPEKNFVIIIDEINRANISKVFGELITLIEDDKRWGEENAVSVTLPSGEMFAVPNNLYIVGTMNSADKSISLIDTALRRRFEFVEFTPNLNLISDAKLKKVLEKLNDGISKELNSTDLLVGHSYFINKDANDICKIMNRNIIPLLYEYFFDNKNKVEAQLKSALEEMDVEIVSNTMGRIKIKKKEV